MKRGVGPGQVKGKGFPGQNVVCTCGQKQGKPWRLWAGTRAPERWGQEECLDSESSTDSAADCLCDLGSVLAPLWTSVYNETWRGTDGTSSEFNQVPRVCPRLGVFGNQTFLSAFFQIYSKESVRKIYN